MFKKPSMFLAALGCAAFSLALEAAPRVYISLGSGNSVIEVDAGSDRILDHYPGVANPHGLVATPDGEYLFAGSLNEDPTKNEDTTKEAAGAAKNSELFMIHPAHGHVMQTIPVAGWSHHQAVTPDGRYVLSTHPTRNHISVVEVASGQQTRTVSTDQAPYYVLVSSDGTRAYVSNSGAGTVQAIDLATWQVVETYDAGPSPEHMVLAKDQQTLFVNNARVGTVSAINLDQGGERQVFEIGGILHGLDISDDGTRLYISNKSEQQLVALDYRSGAQQKRPLEPAPYHLNTITGTGKVYVSSREQPLIWVVDQTSLEVLNTIDLPAGEGHQMAIIGE